MTPVDALALSTAAHLGFQAVVTVVAYPALVEVPAERFDAAHAAHSRRVVVVVGPVYLALLASAMWALMAADTTAALVVCVAALAVVGGVTAFVAAPPHAWLGSEGPVPALLRRLLVADRVRLAGAGVAAVAAVLA